MAPHATPTVVESPHTGHDGVHSSRNSFSADVEASPQMSVEDDSTLPDGDKLEPIAIIGFSFKFPQEATSAEGFWKMLTEKRCCMTKFPKERVNIEAFYHPDPNRLDTIPFRGGHFIEEDLGRFDAPFFSIGAVEAAAMDPQHRLLLETTYRALENAGISMEKASGSKTSVHTGCFTDDYKMVITKDPEMMPAHTGTGVTNAMLAARISWFFNLKGTCLNIDTACSSSLMALHAACQGLLNGDSNMALVGGSSLTSGLECCLPLSNLNFLSHDSRCFSFDDRANGYGRGEGIGMVVLKRLSDALKDGDTVRAVVRSTASNQDGRTPGITQPSEAAQELLIRETYEKAKLDMGETGYVEAHGTGTALGDPLEAHAIGEAFRGTHNGRGPIYIGAVKSNIGHLEGTSGIAGIVKAVLVLETGVIPPNANFERLNSAIDAQDLNLVFPQQATPWPRQGLRRASVSSFGFGGSNVHVVLDDTYNYLRLRNLSGNHCTAPLPPSAQLLENSCNSLARLQLTHTVSRVTENRSFREWTPKIFSLSAADEKGVLRLAKNHAAHLAQLSTSMNGEELEIYLTLLAYNLCSRRSSLPWKSTLVAHSPLDLQDIEGRLSKPLRSKAQLKMCYVFTGQGAQYAGMASGLFAFPVFMTSLRKSEGHFRDFGCSWSLIDEICMEDSTTNINDSAYAQPICTAVQIALVDLFQSWGSTPSTVVGHSSGEIAAAYCVGGLSHRSACLVAFFRGHFVAQLTKSCESGAMMAVGLPESKLAPYLEKLTSDSGRSGVTIGCFNSPNSSTLTGDAEQIDELQKLLEKNNIFNRKLKINVAYHSPQMKAIAKDYALAIKDLEPGENSSPSCAMVSSVNGQKVDVGALTECAYWTSNLTSPVKFLDAISQVCSSGGVKGNTKLGSHLFTKAPDDILEIGPSRTLQGPVKEILGSLAQEAIRYSSALDRSASAVETVLGAFSRFHCLGYLIDLSEINQPQDSSKKQRKMVLPYLPEYPFDHSRNYWHESRLSKEGYRLREHPRLDLLGTPVPDWNHLEPRWRKIHRSSEAPWVKDHKVHGTVIYPAAGFLAMALEASKQMAKKNRSILGFNIRDAVFHSALAIPNSPEGLETQFYLRVSEHNSPKDSTSSEFRVCAYVDSRWGEICRGRVEVEYKPLGAEMDADRHSAARARRYRETFMDSTEKFRWPVKREDFYSDIEQTGLIYGPAFQALDDLYHNNQGEAIGKVKVFQWTASDDSNHPQSHIIHPTTLDAVFQLMILALSKGRKGGLPTMMATRVDRFWISNSGLSFPSIETVNVYAQSEFLGNRRANGRMFALHPTTGEVLLDLEDIEATSVATRENDSQSNVAPRKLCYEITTRPDLDLLSLQQLSSYCESARPGCAPLKEFYEDLGFMLVFFASEALSSLSGGAQERTTTHLTRYVDFLKHKVGLFSVGALPYLSSDNPKWTTLVKDRMYRDEVCQRLESSVQGAFFIRIGRHLPEIIAGSLDPLTFMFQGEFVTEFYREINDKVICYEPFYRYVELMKHKNPGLKILEIGAGTGATTQYILRALGAQEHNTGCSLSCSQYDFTDISPAFFGTASERFARYSNQMSFKVLDIERDPSVQGFAAETYDVVFAASVLHATSNLDRTMQNARKLLKPGGKLVIWEITQDVLRAGFSFGILPGWWLGEEEHRKWGPCVSGAEWHDLMLRNGFSGIDLETPDYLDETCHEYSIIIGTAIQQPQSSSLDPMFDQLQFSEILLITRSGSCFQQDVASALIHCLPNQIAARCSIISFESIWSVNALDRILCIFMLEIEEPYLSNIDKKAFSNLQTLLTKAAGIFWITSGGGEALNRPEFHLVDGLARVARSEFNKHLFVTLALENANLNSEYTVARMFQVLETTLQTSLVDCELEYTEMEGMLCIGRLKESTMLNLAIQDKTGLTKTVVQSFEQHPPLGLHLASPGLLSSLEFVEDITSTQPLEAGEVEIEVEYSGVNFRDCLTALGQIDTKFLGIECAGIISRVGAGCHFNPGDRVAACCLNTFKTYARCPGVCATKIPSDMSSAEASAIPVNFITAWYALSYVAGLRYGETVLIHAGAGGTGQAAIQVAQHFGATVYVTVGSEDKKKLLMSTYDIPEDHIFYSRNAKFAKGIMAITDNRGVDVVLNSLSGEGLFASWESIAPFGRFVEIGKRDINARAKLPMWQFNRHASFTAIDFFYIMQERPFIVTECLQAIISLMAAKKLRLPLPFQIFKVSQIEEAFRYLQSGQNSGKVVVAMRSDDPIEAILKTRPEYYFDSNATYVIAGGLGGLGRSAAKWFASRGAKNLILLSRFGIRTESAVALVEELEAMGVQVKAPPCDVAVADSLSATLAFYGQTMPPIKGVIQAAMVLRDAILDKITFEDWKISTDPKVRGSWNLHSLLPSGMDFFVCLSSISGIIGTVGQGNYAAGNTYMDALVQHRTARGEKATALDLGWMESEGIAAETPALAESFEAAGFLMPITPPEFHALLDVYCNPSLDTKCSQIITGIEPPAVLRRKTIKQPHFMKQASFRQLHQMGNDTRVTTSSEDAVDFVALFRAAASLTAAAGVIAEGLLGRLSKALGINQEDMDMAKPLHTYGVDSLHAVELRNYFAKEYNADVAIFDLMGGSTIEQACLVVARKSGHHQASWAEM